MKFLGHSIHPILIVFPLGLLATAVVFDVVYLVWGNPTLAVVSYWMIVAGIIGGVAAAAFGWIDWFGIEGGTRAKSVGLVHGLINVGVLIFFSISWYLRMATPQHPPLAASIVSIAGVCLAMLGGWLGGELVERLGVSVHKGANADAPSSLSTSENEVEKRASAA